MQCDPTNSFLFLAIVAIVVSVLIQLFVLLVFAVLTSNSSGVIPIIIIIVSGYAVSDYTKLVVALSPAVLEVIVRVDTVFATNFHVRFSVLIMLTLTVFVD